jgi:DNA-binding GntR family transcriptional regulator
MPVPQQRGAVDRHLLRDDAYAALRLAIVTGTLAPGELLHDGELCAWLGLSRTPVREALGRLSEDGLVEIRPRSSTRVTAVERADAHHAFPLVAMLHALATELAVPRLTRDDLLELHRANARFIQALTARRSWAAFDADDHFHGLLVDGAGNPEVRRCLDRLGPRLRRLELLRNGPLPGRRSVAQHEAVISRAAAGDARGAANAARENWLELGGLVERTLADVG